MFDAFVNLSDIHRIAQVHHDTCHDFHVSLSDANEALRQNLRISCRLCHRRCLGITSVSAMRRT